VTKVIYPKYWLTPKVEVIFPRHMAIKQLHFGHPEVFGSSNTFTKPLVNPAILDQ
jgi:hypothetical protein